MSTRPLFSICIPSYNRAIYLRPLLDSILSQDFKDFEIVVCEDCSPERFDISIVIQEYQREHNDLIFYYENHVNLGYDGNIRQLISKANGRYCFFMGNDDLMCEGALAEVARLIFSRENIGLILKSYGWFDKNPEHVSQIVKYFGEECDFKAGKQAIHACFRRSGVIAGYIIYRDLANAFATTKFDGSLFYQMHLTANVLASMNAVFTPKVLVLCRNGTPPEFGNSSSERGKYVPGSFTAQARLNMVDGVLSIVKALKDTEGIDVIDEVMDDYANYFYPCIRDQLTLPISEFWKLYRKFGKMGFNKYPIFHLYCLVAFILGKTRFDYLVNLTQRILGRSLRLGNISTT